MTVPKREEGQAQIAACLGCRKGEKLLEASRARFEHFLSLARSRGPERLKQHMIEQFGEESFNMSYAGAFSHICRRLLVESWQAEAEEDFRERKNG